MEPMKNIMDNQQLTPKEYFDRNGYVVLSDAIPKDKCERLVKNMFDLHKEGKLTKDPQCPLSDSVYGDPEHDSMLDAMCEAIGNHIGKKLIPQYTYARIYRPGEELKRHTDRPECEISATICLGFNTRVPWPIYMGSDTARVDMYPGDMVVYKGCDVEHWRPPLKARDDEWVVQVFIHYTDANGPYKHLKYDGRDRLGVQKNAAQAQNTGTNQADQKVHVEYANPIFGGIMLPLLDTMYPSYLGLDPKIHKDLTFTPEECEKIIDVARLSYGSPAGIGGGDRGVGTINKEIRKADVYDLPMNQEYMWVYEKVAKAVTVANHEYFKFDLLGITHGLQLLHYKYDKDAPVQGHYDWHTDAGPGPSATRKISYVAMLSDSDKYTGGNLQVMEHGNPMSASREKGSVHLFPSYTVHQVTPLESGERYTLVIWVHGPTRFR
jgi:PKHD-type hydroxylase